MHHYNYSDNAQQSAGENIIYQNASYSSFGDTPDRAWQLVNRKRPNHDIIETDRHLLKRNVPFNKHIIYSKQFIATNNKFDCLNTDSNMADETVQEEPETIEKPKPIFITVDNINEVLKLIDSVAKDQYTYKLVNTNQIRLMPNNTKLYVEIAKLLELNKVSFHTFQLTKNRCFRVVLRGIHYTSSLDDLKIEIENKGHKVERIHNVRHRVTKEPLNLFFIDLTQQSNNKDIFSIEYLLHAKIRFEMPYKKKDIVQCQRCQQYGHSKTYCRHPFRCVKCAQNHPTTDCPKKDRSLQAKCVLCDGQHPANYKGCFVYKEIQNRKYPPTRPKILKDSLPVETTRIPTGPEFPPISPRDPRQFNRPKLSYSAVTSMQRNDRNAFTENISQSQYLNTNNNNFNTSIDNNESFKRVEQLLFKQIETQAKLSEDLRTMLNIMSTLITKLAK